MLDARKVEEVSIGDYVLSGGELAAQVLIDACVRLLPGVAGNEVSLAEESFAGSLLEYPHYTRPRDWEGRAIPEVLLSGDHEKIAKWRREQAEAITNERRPDLWEKLRRGDPRRGVIPGKPYPVFDFALRAVIPACGNDDEGIFWPKSIDKGESLG